MKSVHPRDRRQPGGASAVRQLAAGAIYARDQHTAPIRKHRLSFKTEDGQQHIVEVLASGQQVIIEGPHAKGSMHYWRSGDLIDNTEWLRTTQVNGLQISATMLALEAWVDQTPGMEKVKLSAPTSSDSASATKITDLMSPNVAKDRDVLASCMRAIDLDDERIDYDTFISLLRALCAAVNGDMVFFTEQVWPWVCTQKIARGNGPRSEDQGIEWLETRWRSFTDSQLGAEFIYGWAATFNCMDGINAINAANTETCFGRPGEGLPGLSTDADAAPSSDGGIAAQDGGGADGAGLVGGPTVGLAVGPGAGGPLPFNDTHNATATEFEEANVDRWRHDVDSRDWYRFDLGKWVADPRVIADIRTLMFVKSKQVLASVNGPQGAARSRALESAGNMASVKRILEGSSALTVQHDDWDKDAHLLNTPDFIINLRTGEIEAHNPNYLMRGMTAVAPDMLDYGNWEKLCPRWMEFLRRVAFGRPHVIPLLQRWFGYCLTGDLRHQHLLFIQGLPGTGKSQLVTVLLLIIASYAVPLRQSWILKGQDKRFDMVQTIGKRMGFIDETQKGATWDETRGSEQATAELLAAEFKGGATVKFKNTMKLIIAGNHHPHFVSAEAGGLMRRMLLLEMINPPFCGTQEDVSNFAQFLVQEEGPGILAWCIDGARLDYQDEHQHIFKELAQPLLDASKDYARESNPIHDWVEAEMQLGPELDIDLLDAFTRFHDYVRREGGIMRDTRRGFKEALKAAYPGLRFALRTTRKNQGKAYIAGIGFNQVDFGEAAAG